MDGWKTTFPLGIPIFRGELLNFGVGIGSKDQTPFAGRDTASSRVAQWCLGAITAGYRDWCGRRSLEYWYLGRERPQATRISTMENIHCVIHEHTRYIPALVKTNGSQNGWFLAEFPFSKDFLFRLQPLVFGDMSLFSSTLQGLGFVFKCTWSPVGWLVVQVRCLQA